jgi:hypothetical protein
MRPGARDATASQLMPQEEQVQNAMTCSPEQSQHTLRTLMAMMMTQIRLILSPSWPVPNAATIQGKGSVYVLSDIVIMACFTFLLCGIIHVCIKLM